MATPTTGGAPSASSAPVAPQPGPTCDFSHIFSIGEHEIASLPATSEWATKYACAGPVRRYAVADLKAGQVYDSGHQAPGSKAWGLSPRPGTAQVTAYEGCRGGRLVADVVRLDKGHTEGLEPRVTEELLRMITSSAGGKAQRAL